MNITGELHHAGSEASNVARSPVVLVLRSPDEATRIADPAIRRLVEMRFMQVCAGETYDPDRHGYMLVVELATPSKRLSGKVAFLS